MVHGRNEGAGGGGRKIVASDMRCPGVLLGITRQCGSLPLSSAAQLSGKAVH